MGILGRFLIIFLLTAQAHTGNADVGSSSSIEKYHVLEQSYTFSNGSQLKYLLAKDPGQLSQITFYNPKTKDAKILGQGQIEGMVVSAEESTKAVVLPQQYSNIEVKKSKDAYRLAVVKLSDSFLITTQVGKSFSIPRLPDFKWEGAWVYSIVSHDKRVYYVIVNDRGAEASFIVYEEESGKIQSFNFNKDPNRRFVFSESEFQTSVSSDGKLTFKDQSGKEVNPLNDKELKSILLGEEFAQKASENKKIVERGTGLTHELAQKIKVWLEKTVIGQPEAVEVATSLVMRDVLYGSAEVPDVMVLMGSPASGKDTLVNNFVDAIYQEKGAYKEHVFRVNPLKSVKDAYSLIGSPTGYVGSSDMMPFHRWLVAHSGGRYEIVEKKGAGAGSNSSYIQENKNWVPGTVLEGYSAPEKAVLFINEFHDWAKEAKNIVLKEALEFGRFKINNPGSGVHEIFVPIKIIIATNEGIELTTSREISGERYGRPLSYEEMMQKYNAVGNNQTTLKEAFSRTNAVARMTGGKEDAPGISEEMSSRLRNLVLMRPLAPSDLKTILRIKLSALQEKFTKAKERGGSADFNFKFTDNLVDVIQGYKYIAEENARPLEAKIESMIDRPLNLALLNGTADFKTGESYTVDIQTKADKTLELVFTDSKNSQIRLPISVSQSDVNPGRMTESQLDKVLDIEDRLKKHVFGAEEVIKRVSTVLIDTEEGRHIKATELTASQPARAFMFLGPSSTGKTELAKAIAREHLGSEEKLTIFDFNQVEGVQDLKTRILGTKDSYGNPVPSEFMKAYDRAGGDLVVVLDEIANAGSAYGRTKEVLKGLYDLLREPVVRTFSDGKPRVMSNVIIIMTGNAGEEWYAAIPKEIPETEQQAAREQIYKEAMERPGFRRSTLEKYFSPALLNRIGEQNIFFFASLSFQAVRELTQHKFLKALERLKATETQWGWNIKFKSESDYVATLEVLEKYGMVLEEQGASIDRYIKSDFELYMRQLLRNNKIKAESDVLLEPVQLTAENEKDAQVIEFNVYVEGSSQPLKLALNKRKVPTDVTERLVDRVSVAYHEAGHEFVRRVLFGTRYESERISIIPGVTEINNQMIRYLGIAQYEKVERYPMTREAVIAHLAVWAAGEIGQTVVTDGYRPDAGKRNDMERATMMAKQAIISYGLSERWGNHTAPESVNLEEYISNLPEERKKILYEEVDIMMKEARLLAFTVIRSNWKVWTELGMTLAEKGDMLKEDLRAFYQEHGDKIDSQTFEKMMEDPQVQAELDELSRIKKRWALDVNLKSPDLMPANVADIENIINTRKQEAVSRVALPKNLPLQTVKSSNVGGSCASLF